MLTRPLRYAFNSCSSIFQLGPGRFWLKFKLLQPFQILIMPATLLPVLTVNNLHWSWDCTKLLDLDVLQLPAGITWVGGGEGVGKTTLLQLLAGVLVDPSSTLMLSGLHAGGSDAYFQRVFWIDPLTKEFDQISAEQFFAVKAKCHPTWSDELLAYMVEVLGLKCHECKPLYMLSTGSKRKVWLAAAFASGATLTLLDSPFAALDKTSTNHLLDCFKKAARHPTQAWVIADYQPPPGVPLACSIGLGN